MIRLIINYIELARHYTGVILTNNAVSLSLLHKRDTDNIHYIFSVISLVIISPIEITEKNQADQADCNSQPA